MTRLEKKRRAPEMKGWGQALAGGALVTWAVSGGDWRRAVVLAIGGVAFYAQGARWE